MIRLESVQRVFRVGGQIVHALDDNHAHAALALIERLHAHPLRTLDAIHLAIAQAIGSEILATADRVMAHAAETMGFQVAMFG